MKNAIKIKVILYQKPLGINIPRKDFELMKKFDPHFICFPEYFFVDKKLGNHKQTPENQLKQLQKIEYISKELNTTVIGGTMPELVDDKLYNTSFIYDRGRQIGYYRKKNLFSAEEGKITPGDEYKVFSANGIQFGVLICADVFNDESFQFMKNNQARIIFSPTFSLYKDETIEKKFERDKNIYIRGASIAEAVIVKVCGVKSEYIPYLQARSLIADKNKIIFRVKPEEENKSIVIMTDIEI